MILYGTGIVFMVWLVGFVANLPAAKSLAFGVLFALCFIFSRSQRSLLEKVIAASTIALTTVWCLFSFYAMTVVHPKMDNSSENIGLMMVGLIALVAGSYLILDAGLKLVKKH